VYVCMCVCVCVFVRVCVCVCVCTYLERFYMSTVHIYTHTQNAHILVIRCCLV